MSGENLRIVPMGAVRLLFRVTTYVAATDMCTQNGLCLCQQHEPDSTAHKGLGQNNIKVTIYILHHRMKLKISIAMPSGNFDTISSDLMDAHVFFDSIGDLLMIYIPGYYLQFVDCGEEHEPCGGLYFSGSRFATMLPQQVGEFAMIAQHFNACT